MARRAILHINGTDYPLPEQLADPPYGPQNLSNLRLRLQQCMSGAVVGLQQFDIQPLGYEPDSNAAGTATLMVRSEAITAAGVYVVDTTHGLPGIA